jgi:hypothetical protein
MRRGGRSLETTSTGESSGEEFDLERGQGLERPRNRAVREEASNERQALKRMSVGECRERREIEAAVFAEEPKQWSAEAAER